MKRYRLSKRAESDLEDIWVYVAGHRGVEVADRMVAEIVDRFALLATHPERPPFATTSPPNFEASRSRATSSTTVPSEREFSLRACYTAAAIKPRRWGLRTKSRASPSR